MAGEKRLIDAKPLMQSGWHLVRTGENNKFIASMSLADVPAADTVEVVQCKDCQSSKYFEATGKRRCGNTRGLFRTVADDEYCSCGERKYNG